MNNYKYRVIQDKDNFIVQRRCSDGLFFNWFWYNWQNLTYQPGDKNAYWVDVGLVAPARFVSLDAAKNAITREKKSEEEKRKNRGVIGKIVYNE